MKEALVYWRRYEKVEREQRKKAEKEAMEQRKRDDEMREVGEHLALLCWPASSKFLRPKDSNGNSTSSSPRRNFMLTLSVRS